MNINKFLKGKSINSLDIDNVSISDDFILHVVQQIIVDGFMYSQITTNNDSVNRVDYIQNFFITTRPYELKKIIKDWTVEYKIDVKISDTNKLKEDSWGGKDYVLRKDFMKFVIDKILDRIIPQSDSGKQETAISIFIKNKRQSSGLSVEEVLNELNKEQLQLNLEKYNEIENGKTDPTGEEFLKIKKVLEEQNQK